MLVPKDCNFTLAPRMGSCTNDSANTDFLSSILFSSLSHIFTLVFYVVIAFCLFFLSLLFPMTCAECVARSVVAVDRRSTRARTNGDLIVSFGVSWFSHASITA